MPDETPGRSLDRASEVRQGRPHLDRMFHQLLAHTPVVVWMVDRTGTVEFAAGKPLDDEAAQEGQLGGKALFAAACRHAGLLVMHRRAFHGERPDALLEVGGRAFQCHFAPARFDGDRIEAIIGVAAEVTRLRGAERRAARAAAARDLMLRFCGGAGHEVANAVQVLNFHFEGLRRQETRAGAAPDPALVAVADDLDRLTMLLEDLLVSTRIHTGKLALRSKTLDLAPVLRETADDLRGTFEDAGVTFEVDLPEDLPVEADPLRIRQVVGNLLSNACKFTPRGGRVTLRAMRAGRRMVVEVEDTGRGLAADHLAEVFEPFYRGADVEDGSRGTGLGLFMARGIIEAHGGSLEVDSPGPGRGATFRFTLALRDRPGAGARASAAQQPF